MATLDISDAFSPELTTTIERTRRTEAVDASGRLTLVSSEVALVRAVVTAIPPQDFHMLPHGTIPHRGIRVTGIADFSVGHTEGAFIYSADVLTWRGVDYRVVAAANYAHFGRGFVRAWAVNLESLSE